MTAPAPTHVYCFSGSPFVWRVLIALEEKELPYTTTYLARMSGDHRTPEMLGLNPRGKLPIMTHGDAVLYESLAILSLLERRYPEPRLTPASLVEEGRAWVRMQETSYLVGPFDALGFYAMGHREGGGEPARMKELGAAFAEELTRWEVYLQHTPWLAGSTFSLADIALFGHVAFAVRLGLDLDARWPCLAAWYQRMQARASVQATWPPHWKTSEPWDLGFDQYI